MASKSKRSSENSKTDNVCDTICKLIQDSDATAAPVITIVEENLDVLNDLNTSGNSDKINDDELDDLVEEQLVLSRIKEMENRRRNLGINRLQVKNVDVCSSVDNSNHNNEAQNNDDNDSLLSFMDNSSCENDERRYKDDLDKLSKALTVNIVMQSELNKLEIYLVEKLKQNQKMQLEVNYEIRRCQYSEDKTMTGDRQRSSYAKFGMPYFKDIRKFSCDSNSDIKKMKSCGQMLSININFSKVWRLKEKTSLEKAVRNSLIEENTAELHNRITTLKTNFQDATTKKEEKEIKSEMKRLKMKIETIKKKSLVNLFSSYSSDREFDWYTISADHVRTHSSLECQRMWHLYVKPSVNKAKWTVKEDEKLLELVNKYEKQNWDEIAKELATSRSAYQCFVNYQTRLNKEMHKLGRWTAEEDKALASLIGRCRVGYYIPWTKIAYYFQGRSLAQIYGRWKNSLKPGLKKGRFSRQEDRTIVSYVRRFGEDFNKISKLLGDRTSSQLRERYLRAIPIKYHNIGRWSLDEDKLLISLVKKHGISNWSIISKQFVTRSRTQVRQRYSAINKLLTTNSGLELEDIYRSPKAMAQCMLPPVSFVKGKNRENKSLKELISQHKMQEALLKNRTNSLITRSKAGRKKISKRKDVDVKLLNYFKEAYTNENLKLKTHYLKPDVDKAVDAMAVFCQFLQTHIKLPQKGSNDYKKLPFTLRNIAQKMQEQFTEWGCDCLGSNPSTRSNFCFCQEQTSIDCTPVDLKSTLVDDGDYLLNSAINLIPIEDNERRCMCLQNRIRHVLPYYLPPNIITSIGFRSVLLIKDKIATYLSCNRRKAGRICHDDMEFRNNGLKKFTGYFSEEINTSSDEESVRNERNVNRVISTNVVRKYMNNSDCNLSSSVSMPSTSSSSVFSSLIDSNGQLMTRPMMILDDQSRSPSRDSARRLNEQEAIHLWKERLIAILGWPIVLANQPTNFPSDFNTCEQGTMSEQLTGDDLAQQEGTSLLTEDLLPEETDLTNENRILTGSNHAVKRKIDDTSFGNSNKSLKMSYKLFEDYGNLENNSDNKSNKDFKPTSNKNHGKTIGINNATVAKSSLAIDDILPVEKISFKKSYTRSKPDNNCDILNRDLSSTFIGLNKVHKCYSRKKGSTKNKM